MVQQLQVRTTMRMGKNVFSGILTVACLLLPDGLV